MGEPWRTARWVSDHNKVSVSTERVSVSQLPQHAYELRVYINSVIYGVSDSTVSGTRHTYLNYPYVAAKTC